MYFIIDNYDSFVYNLSAYVREAGHDVLVRRAGDVSLDEIRNLNPEGIIISPGPKHPKDAHVSRMLLEEFEGEIPILGVCLGHQLIGHFYGAKVCKGASPIHGKLSPVTHDGDGLFTGLSQNFRVTRYHSLIVSEEELPPCLRVTARTDDGVIMGLSHKDYPIYGVQFHPEAVLTEYGHELLENFHKLCMKWNAQHEREVA